MKRGTNLRFSAALYFLIGLPILTASCSGKKPNDVVLDDAARLLTGEQLVELRNAQQKYHDSCKGALAIVTVDKIPRLEPGAFADDRFRDLIWPAWVESATPKALILCSVEPGLVQVRMSNRWVSIDELIRLQRSITDRNQPMVAQHQLAPALLGAAQMITANCPQPIDQGWIKRQATDAIANATDTVESYAYPRSNLVSRWYYTLLFEPVLNGAILVLNLFGFAPWILVACPLALLLCSDESTFSFLGRGATVAVIKAGNWVNSSFVQKHSVNIVGLTGLSFSLIRAGFRWVVGLPSYAVLCILVFWRPEDALTAKNHLYSWIPLNVLGHLPVRGWSLGSSRLLEPSGVAFAAIYLVAQGILVGFSVWKDVMFGALDDEERRRFGVIGEWYKEYQEEGSNMLEDYLKRIWKHVFFAVVISVAPLALSLYFVVKAACDAAGQVIPALALKLKMKVPVITLYVPHILVLATLLVAYSRVMGSSPANPATRTANPVAAEVSYALEQWAAAIRARNLDALMGCYRDPLDTYYMQRQYSAARLREQMLKAFSRYQTLDIQLSGISVSVDPSGQSASATFTKTWIFKGAKQFSGSVRETDSLVKAGGHWLITGVRDG